MIIIPTFLQVDIIFFKIRPSPPRRGGGGRILRRMHSSLLVEQDGHCPSVVIVVNQ